MRRPRLRAPTWIVLSIWVVVIAGLATVGLRIEDHLAPVSLAVDGTPSARAQELLDQRFGESVQVAVLLKGPEAEVDRQGPRLVRAFRRAGDVQVLSPWESADELSTLRPSADAALVVASFKRPKSEAAAKVLPAARRVVRTTISPPVDSHLSGIAVISEAIERASIDATHRAERIALPVLLLVLLLVFRSPVAALVPLMIGAATVLAGRGLLTLAALIAPINSLGVAIASMMGLALGVDYALLMVSRLRQERAAGADMATAVETAASAAGRTILFAGGTLVLAMITATVVASGSLLSSVAIGVVISGVLSVVLALSLMPALLSAMGESIERWRLPSLGRRARGVGALGALIARPAIAVPLILVAMLAIAAPSTALSLGPPDVRQLPESDPTRQSFEAIEQAVSPGWTAPYVVVASARDGVIGKPRRLRAMARWQDRIARSPDVAAVIGPASLRRGERALRRAKDEYAAAPGRLADARRGLDDLRAGLAEARDGVAELRAGLAAGAGGADRLGAGARRAQAGAAKLRRGLERASAGSRRLAHGLDRSVAGADRLVKGNRRLAEGADELARGIAELDGGLRTALAPIAVLADQLRSWSGWLRSLREPTELATSELELALGELDRMAAAGDDPLLPELRQAIEQAYAAITGTLPPGATLPALPPPISIGPGAPGSIPTESVRGIAPILLAMQGELASTADGLAEIPDGLDRLTDGLDRLTAGAGELSRGARRTERGAMRLRTGLRRLSAGAHRLDRGIGSLHGGAGRLEHGLAALAGGADTLAGGLRSGHARSARLERGLAEGAGPLADYAMVLRGYARGYRALDTRSPGAIDSGYLILTALDGTTPAMRDQLSQIVNLDGGGQAARILVVPRAGPSTPSTERLGRKLEDELPALALASNTDVEVGEGAQSLHDYAAATRARLPWLMLALAIVATLTLVLVVRSLVLPPVAVALTLLTIGAALGGLELLFRVGILDGPRYLDAISAAGILAIMFVLAIDYLVFLLTRMREGWLATGDHEHAIAYGLRNTAGVITGAAAIMAAVFLAFASADVASLKQFGAGLTIAVILDATVVRLVLLPAIMRGLGPRAWWMPRWLDERLPNIDHGGPAPAREGATGADPVAQPDTPIGEPPATAIPAATPTPASSPAASAPATAPMSPIAELGHAAHAEHGEFLELLREIDVAAVAGDREAVGGGARALRAAAEPHFRYEQRALFPQLVDVLGSDYVESLYDDQEDLAAALDRIEALAGNGGLDARGTEEIHRLVRAATAAVANCDGLTVVVEGQGQAVAERVLAARERALSGAGRPSGAVAARRPRPTMARSRGRRRG